MKIQNRIIEAIYNNEISAQNYFKIYGKENIEKECAEILKSNKEIAEKYPAEKIKPLILQKLNKNQNQNKNSKISKFTVLPAVAAVMLLAIFLPVTVVLKNSEKNIILKNENFRIKGLANSNYETTANTDEKQNTQICLYRKNSNGIQLLSDGDFAKNGDIIQITYKPGKNNYGVIFSVDGNGNITRHFPEKSWKSEKLSREKSEIPLNFSYQLDNAPNFECFVMVSSKNQFDLGNIEKKIKNSKDVEYLKKLNFLPKKTDKNIFILEK